MMKTSWARVGQSARRQGTVTFGTMSSGEHLSEAYDFAEYANWSRADDDYADDGGWCEAGEQERAIKVFQACLFAVIFLLGVAGNLVVMATLAASRRRSATDAFLLQLALADLLLLLTLPLQAADTNVGWIFSAPACKLARAVYAVNTYGGLLLLACIAVDRYLAVVRRQEPPPLARLAAAAGVWVAAALLSLPEILFSDVARSGGDAYCGTLAGARIKTAANGAAVAVFAVCFLVMATCYAGIARVLWAGRGVGGAGPRRRSLKLMAALVALFVLLQLPHSAVLSVKMARPLCAPLLEYVTRSLAYARCCLNPVTYVLAGRRFRGDALRLLRRLRADGAAASLSSPTPAT